MENERQEMRRRAERSQKEQEEWENVDKEVSKRAGGKIKAEDVMRRQEWKEKGSV